MIVTKISELLGIRYPIFQGGMAWVSDAELAAAVSNAGGLGIISAMSMDGESLRAEIRKAKELTEKPFGVNIMLLSPHVAEVAEVAAQEKVAVVTTGAGSPGKYMPAWLEAGIKVIPVIASVAMAVRAVRSGACALVAEGGESGGHVGEITTMALIPQICDAVDVPVLAAGGIGDGRGMAAALMLGAQGVQVGTRFLVAKECTIHPHYKERILAARDIDTVVTGKRIGSPVRALKNAFTQAFMEMENTPDMSRDEMERFGSGSLRKAAREGDVKNGSLMAGQIAGLVNKEQTAEEILREMEQEAEGRLMGAAAWVK